MCEPRPVPTLICAACGVEVERTGGRQVMCPGCGAEARRESMRVRNRRRQAKVGQFPMAYYEELDALRAKYRERA